VTRKPIIMLVDDEPIPEVEIARAAEHHSRTTEFGRLCNEGHVRVLNDDDPLTIRCKVENEVFSCRRDIFPTTELMARLQLAIAAGLTCRKLPRTEFHHHQVDAYAYAYGLIHKKVWVDEHYGAPDWARDEAVAQGYSNVAKKTRKVTAAVKGLRP
jgi:hypothetical protein